MARTHTAPRARSTATLPSAERIMTCTSSAGARRRPLRSPAQGVSAPLALILLLVAAGACASHTPHGFTSNVTATTIVRQNADDAFVTQLTAADLPALTQFKTQIGTARARADLISAWKGIPALDARGSDFLQARVFAKSIDDGDWPAGAPANDLELAFVTGVQQATADFIARGGH